MSATAPGGEHPDIRISDQDRERVVELLRKHTADGRITLDEFSERVGQVYAARTQRELDTVTADLPVPRRPTPAPAPPAPPAPTRRSPPSPRPRPQPPAAPSSNKWVVACMSGARRRGPWAPGQRVTALAFMGGVDLDLREARLDDGEVSISAVAIMGGVEIIVAPGTRVEFSGFGLMGNAESRVPDVPLDDAIAIVHVSAFALMGGVDVKVKPPRTRREDRSVSRRPDRPLEPGATPSATPRTTPGVAADNGRPPAGAPATGTVTILFTDVEAFTDLTDRLGDEVAHDLVRRHAAAVRQQIAACGGLEVNTAGDGFMIAFSSARQAVRCAVAIQRSLAGWKTQDGTPVRVRIGVHTGDAISDADDFFGQTVNVASRIAGSAAGGEVLVSSVTRSLVGNMGDVEFGEERTLELRGVSGQHRVHVVDWAGADATQ